MGRYRRGHKYQKRGRGRKHYGGGGDSSSHSHLTDEDWILLEKYLLEYRTKAYQSKRQRGNCHRQEHCSDAPVLLGGHKFPPLTMELVSRPYIDLPNTLSGKERHRIHTLSSELDLYHAGAGKDDKKYYINNKADETNGSNESNGDAPTLKRRIAISIFADGLDHVPDIESSHNTSKFPSRSCQPWYHRAHGYAAMNKANSEGQSNPYQQRMEAIEKEKQQIRQLASLPEQSLRESDCLDFGVLESLDLSCVPSSSETPWMLVDTVEKLQLCVDELVYGVKDTDDGARSPKIRELAFDLEMCTVGEGKSKEIRTCLIQVTSDVATFIQDESGLSKEVYKEFIIDPFNVWNDIPKYLGPLFSNPSIVKIGHGIGGGDVSSLHRDFGILVVNAFDTYEASTVLSERKGGMGLAHLCHHYGLPDFEHYKRLKSKYQASDWRRRPLCSEALEYGRYDIRFLVTLRKLLMRDLAKFAMIGTRRLKFGTSMEDDSDFEPAPTSGAELPSFDSQVDNEMSSDVLSASENEVNGNSSSSLDQPEGTVEKSRGGHLGVGRTIINASELPAYEMLMKAMSTSQRRCLKLWTGSGDEAIMRNASLLSIIKNAANQKGPGKHWTDAHMQLYKQLCEWRKVTARKEFISASEVCSLDFLVHVAYKLQTHQCEMRRYSYALPALLEDTTLPYCDELCKLVETSDVHRLLSESKGMDVIFYFYSGDDSSAHEEEPQASLLKLAIASIAIGAVLLVVGRVGKR